MQNIFKKFFRKSVGIPYGYTFQDKSPVYLFSNENISGYLRPLNLQDARVLSVGASGDHAFEAYLAGAEHVDTFDINSMQRPVVELKTHMIRELDYDAFRDFFFSKNHFFDTQMLRGIQSSFSPELQRFLQDCKSKRASVLKYDAAQNPLYKTDYISYLQSPEQYEQLSRALPEQIPFRHCNLMDLSRDLDGKYDFMMLSNIFEYLYQNSGILDFGSRMMAYYRDVLQDLSRHNLKPGGKICYHYMWGGSPAAWANFMGYFEDEEFYPATRDRSTTFRSVAVEPMMRGDLWDIALFMSKKSR